jgi:hypothetical protein
MRQSHLQVESIGDSARARTISSRSISTSTRLLRRVGLEPGSHRGGRRHSSLLERLAAFEPRELRHDQVDAMLRGDGLHGSLPPARAAGPQVAIGVGLETASRARPGHDEQLRPIERGDGRHQRVPRVLAHDHGGAPESGVVGLNRESRLDETLFVEDSVGGKENLAVNVPDARVGSAEAGRHRGIVQPGAPTLVEAGNDFHRRSPRLAVHSCQVLEQLLGGERELLHPAFEEVSGERGLGKGEQVGWCL